MHELSLLDTGELIGRYVQALWCNRGSVRAAAGGGSRE
jgi:hypothetical protein